jgi:L-fucose isomerase-like protein
MKKECIVGFVTVLSGRWPRELPQQRLKEYGEWAEENLAKARVVKYPVVADNLELISKAVSLFKKEEVDVVIMLYGAFTGDDFPCALAEGLEVPIILWAPYEPPFERDTRLFANALVAATMNAAALHKIDRLCHVIYGSKEDDRAAKKLMDLVSAYGVKKSLKNTLLGLLGYRPTAFYNCAFDESLIRKTFGVRIEETDLKVIFDRMEQLPPDMVKHDMKTMSCAYDTNILPVHHLENHSKLYFAIKQIIEEQGYDFATIKCWPEMGSLHTTPCAVLGRLADEGIGVVCEGDVDAGLATIVQRYLTGLPTFVADMINIDETENTLTYWHCGNAAPSLMNPNEETSINNHPLAGQGTAFYGTLKPGKVTMARFCNIGGVYKLFLLRGEAVASKRNTRGVMVNVKVKKSVRDILQRIFDEGIAHHYSIVWDDIADAMIGVAHLLGIEVIEP